MQLTRADEKSQTMLQKSFDKRCGPGLASLQLAASPEAHPQQWLWGVLQNRDKKRASHCQIAPQPEVSLVDARALNPLQH